MAVCVGSELVAPTEVTLRNRDERTENGKPETRGLLRTCRWEDGQERRAIRVEMAAGDTPVTRRVNDGHAARTQRRIGIAKLTVHQNGVSSNVSQDDGWDVLGKGLRHVIFVITIAGRHDLWRRSLIEQRKRCVQKPSKEVAADGDECHWYVRRQADRILHIQLLQNLVSGAVLHFSHLNSDTYSFNTSSGFVLWVYASVDGLVDPRRVRTHIRPKVLQIGLSCRMSIASSPVVE